MHLHATPDKLASLAPFALGAGSRSSGRSRLASEIRKRNEAIAAALQAGHSAIEIGDRVGLTVRSVEEIAKKVAPPAASEAPVRPAGMMPGKVSFDDAGPVALAVLTLQADSCRWPLDGDGDFRFCGARVVAGQSGGLKLRSFCAAHAHRAYSGRHRVVMAEAV